MFKEFSQCFLFLVLFLYLAIATVMTYAAAILISSYQNLNELRLSDECENCGVKAISILITIAIVALTFILVGCFGLCRNKKPMSKFLMVFFVLFCIELLGGILIYIKGNKIKSDIQENMNATFRNYNEDPVVKKAIDHLQQYVQCCGVNNAGDWLHYHGFQNGTLPKSCCSNDNCWSESQLFYENVFQMGCYTKICNVFTQNRVLFYILVGLFFLIQFLGLIFGLNVSCKTKSLES